APTPSILHWDQNHFVVLFQCKGKQFVIGDPARGILKFSEEEFLVHWSQGKNNGIILLLDPTPRLFSIDDENDEQSDFTRFFSYIFRFRKLLLQLILGYAIGSFLQILLPFL